MTSVIQRLVDTTDELREEILVPSSSSSRFTLAPLFDSPSVDTRNVSIEPLRPTGRKRNVVGIDSTCVPLAESVRGVVYAASVCSVRLEEESFAVNRFGPLLVYMTAETESDLLTEFSGNGGDVEIPSSDSRKLPRIIMTMLERWTLAEVVRESFDTVVLLDGPLSSSDFELRNSPLGQILRTAHDNENTVLGVSKNSKLFKVACDQMITLSQGSKPAVAEILEARKHVRRVLGRVYLGYLSFDGVPLRLDVSFHEDEPLRALESLIASDQLTSGYPETLRQAHILCKLSYSEKAGLRASLNTFDAVLLHSERDRDIIFGSFNHRKDN